MLEIITTDFTTGDFLKTRFISGSFLQSSIWKNFLVKQKKQVFELVAIEDGQTLAAGLFYENKLPLGFSYIYAPKGPVFLKNLPDYKKQEVLALILSKVRDICIETKKQEEIFCKIETEGPPQDIIGFKKSDDIQPRATQTLDITKSEAELLGKMHPKTRYNISLAQRKGVKIRFSKNLEDIKIFLRLIKKTAIKNQITVHSDEYYKLLCQSLFEQDAGELVIAELDNRPIACNIMISFGSSTTYLHGASDYQWRSHMAPHLLQWESIKKAKQAGDNIYDFWGITPSDGSKPNWSGITRFKQSFGGQQIEAGGAYDFIYQPAEYNLYVFSKKIRNIFKK